MSVYVTAYKQGECSHNREWRSSYCRRGSDFMTLFGYTTFLSSVSRSSDANLSALYVIYFFQEDCLKFTSVSSLILSSAHAWPVQTITSKFQMLDEWRGQCLVLTLCCVCVCLYVYICTFIYVSVYWFRYPVDAIGRPCEVSGWVVAPHEHDAVLRVLF